MKKLLAFTIGLLLVTTVVAQDGQEKKSSGDSPIMWLGGERTN